MLSSQARQSRMTRMRGLVSGGRGASKTFITTIIALVLLSVVIAGIARHTDAVSRCKTNRFTGLPGSKCTVDAPCSDASSCSNCRLGVSSQGGSCAYSHAVAQACTESTNEPIKQYFDDCVIPMYTKKVLPSQTVCNALRTACNDSNNVPKFCEDGMYLAMKARLHAVENGKSHTEWFSIP